MWFYYTDEFELPLPSDHSFPMSKYRLLRERIQRSSEIPNKRLSSPPAATDEQLLRVHSRSYVRDVVSGTLDEKAAWRIGFPWSPEMVERSRRSVGATVAASSSCLDDGWAVNLAGGTHHAYHDAGSGYCVFNDVAVAIRELQSQNKVDRCVVVDCDAHQGDGTAALFADDPSVFTCSLHAQKAFPARKQASDLDIAFADKTSDSEYLSALRQALQRIDEWGRPSIAFYLAGADPFSGDRLGRLSISKAGLAQRDNLVFDWLTARQIPVTITMAGGYARDVQDIVDVHFSTVTAAWGRWSERHVSPIAD